MEIVRAQQPVLGASRDKLPRTIIGFINEGWLSRRLNGGPKFKVGEERVRLDEVVVAHVLQNERNDYRLHAYLP